MKCADVGYLLHSTAILLLTFPCINATPPMYSLFQGAPYSSSIPRQRNKNWCAFVVHKNVTYAVLGMTETVTESDTAPCPEHLPHCAQTGIFRTHVRPMYKVGYKQVTELEWRCCPGYRGYDCMELKDVPSLPQLHHDPQPDQTYIHKPQHSVTGPEESTSFHPWIQPGQPGQTRQPWTDGRESGSQGNQHDSQRVSELEEEVKRLSQTVLDLQTAMTSANANLRLNLQEDASKIILNLLGNQRQPQNALTGGTESIVLPTDLTFSPISDELQNKVTHLSETISTNTDTIQGLEARLLQLEGKVNGLTEAVGITTAPLPSSSSTTECSCQAYIDEKLEIFQKEILEGMDIKMADLKNSCDYKVLSVKEHCEEQENAYLSLTELLESKEADLRQEIQDLRNTVLTGTPEGLENPEIQVEIQILKNAHERLASAVNATKMQHKTLEDSLDARLSLTEKRVEESCHQMEEKLRTMMAQEEESNSKELESKISEALQILGGAQSQIIPLTDKEKQTASMRDEMSDLMQKIKHLENSVHVLNDSVCHKSHTDDLYNKLNKLEEDCGRSQESAKRVEVKFTGMDGRVTSVEGVCGQFEPMSESLKRIKDGLNKHVNGLWNCVKQLNNTVLTHSTDINTLREEMHTTADKWRGTTGTKQYTGVLGGMEDSSVITEKVHSVLESGEAGPPGTIHSSRSPQGANGDTAPVKGYAAAPGYPSSSPVSFTYVLPGSKSVSAPVSFSAGLALHPFAEEVGNIRFNKVLLNDGGHYDEHTGVFTVPADGQYLLSATITAQKGERVEAVLSVANHNIQKLDTAGSGGVDSTDCLCGGSAATSLVLDLKKGQRVGVVKTSGTLAISGSTEVLSTFSGVLLYPLPAKR